MLRNSRLIGGILLVSGTAIGAGMLAIPVISSFAGFFPSFALLILCWLFLFATAWLLLDVNLACPGDVNLISMAERHLGWIGKSICWAIYLLLLYSLTAAYIAGSSPLFLQAIEWATGIIAPTWFGPFPLLFLFGIFVYLGTRSVDWVNRVLMAGLIISYFILVAFLPPHIQPALLQHSDPSMVWIAIPIVITSFGFHIIIPTLTTYLHHNVKQLRLTIFLGSIIPLVVYSIWELLILGIVPIQGENGLIQAWIQGETGVAPLRHILQNRWIGAAASAFSFFAIVTSFLGVSLSLSDFLIDGLKMKRFSVSKEIACLLTFIPPLLFVYFYPRGFLLALQYAGIFVVILLCIFPALMAWRLPRYRSHISKFFLTVIIVISLFVIGVDFLEGAGILKRIINSYVQT
jgi:tyrosine-specific transport protein